MTQTVTNAEARALSVQGKTTMGIPLTMQSIERKALLPRFGSQAREIALRNLYRNPHNTLVQGAIGGITSKIVSTPFEVMGPTDAESENAQAMLLNACFGKGAEYLFSVTALNYQRHDRGVYWELIGYGDPNGALVGSPVAVNVLDPLRCFPTGDDEHPTWYYSYNGKIHQIHRSRLVHFIDMPDGDEDHPDVGLCGMSRAVAIAEREILMGRYTSTRLDDKPKPGIMLFRNIDEDQFKDAMARYNAMLRGGLSEQEAFGQVVQLFGLDPGMETGVEYVSYSEAPEKYDYIAYVNLDAKELALALGVDIQEIWELSGGNIGTSTQSQILHEKSKGKTIGRLRKAIERALNLYVLPPECEFRWQYRDSQEDTERANLASTWATTIITLAGDLTPMERRQLAANQIEAVGDVILDAQGQVRLPDDDIDPARPTITEDDENTEDDGRDLNLQPNESPVEVEPQSIPEAAAVEAPQTETSTKPDQAEILGMLEAGLITIGDAQRRLGQRVDPTLANMYMRNGVPLPREVYVQLYQTEFGRGVLTFENALQQPVEVAEAPVKAVRKDFDATGSKFAERFTSAVASANAGEISRRSLGIRLRGQLKSLGTQAYRDGMAEGGSRRDLDDDDRAAVQTWLAEQSRFVTHFTDEVTKQGLSEAQIAQRADAWVANSLGEMRLRGLASVKANQYMAWKMQPGAEHCRTCRKLDGQVHRLKDWLSYGFYPKASTLECFIGCKCGLEPSDGPAQGNLRSVPYIRLRKQRKEPRWRSLFSRRKTRVA